MQENLADQPSARLEIITDSSKIEGELPIVTVRTGETAGQTVFFKIHQPKGRALLVALHF